MSLLVYLFVWVHLCLRKTQYATYQYEQYKSVKETNLTRRGVSLVTDDWFVYAGPGAHVSEDNIPRDRFQQNVLWPQVQPEQAAGMQAEHCVEDLGCPSTNEPDIYFR